MAKIYPIIHTDCCHNQQCIHLYVPDEFAATPMHGRRICIQTDGKTISGLEFQSISGYTSLLKNRLPPEDRKIGSRQMLPILTEKVRTRDASGRNKLDKLIHLCSYRDVLYNMSIRFANENSHPNEWKGGSEALLKWQIGLDKYLLLNPVDLGKFTRRMTVKTLQPHEEDSPSNDRSSSSVFRSKDKSKRNKRTTAACETSSGSDTFDQKHNYSKDVEIRESTIPRAGDGAFTLVARSKGEAVGAYIGKSIPRKVFDKMSKQMINQVITLVDKNGREHYIDGSMSNHFSSKINHKWKQSRNPIGAANIYPNCNGVLIALRNIAVGEELFMDYGPKYWIFQLFDIDVDELEDTFEQEELRRKILTTLPN